MAERIHAEDFNEKVLQSEVPVLVEFYGDSCIPCKKLAPVLAEVEESLEGELKIYKVNVNFDADLADQHQVMASPTLLLFKEGKKVGSKQGVLKKQELVEWVTA